MTFACYTLGCKTNQTETDALAAILQAHGHTEVTWGAPCDAAIINTCSVTAVSDKKSRAVIRRMRREQPEVVLAVHGCMAQGGVDPTLGIDVLGGTGDRNGFLSLVERAVTARGSQPVALRTQAAEHQDFEVLPVVTGTARTRAFFKVQDGCSGACAYCIIPSLRGPSRSLSLPEVLAGGDALAAQGVCEIVLTGIEISAYQSGAADLPTMVSAIAAAHPAIRFRLGSVEPSTLTPHTIKTLAAIPNLCPHFHIALQSGCDNTLLAMNRRYPIAAVSHALTLLRAALPHCTLGCDVIVGFPGETEEDFAASLQFIEAQQFTFMHIFPYSLRPNTPAAARTDQVPAPVKQERAKRAAALSDRLLSAHTETLVGRELPVLFETEIDGVSRGHADNYREVQVAATNLHNTVQPVRITHATNHILIGDLQWT